MNRKKILDACCGSRMFWFDKNNADTVFMDCRSEEHTLCDGRTLEVRPDVVGDFRDMPFSDNSFYLVVFDPPHLNNLGKSSWLAKKYGRLLPTWEDDIRRGPAFNEPGGDFVPGMYMKKGYVITSRGCPNRCWFCAVPKREGGQLRELPVTDGWIVTDDNLLACSSGHIDEVFAMLSRQPHRPQFVGGLEAALMTPEMAVRLRGLKPESMFFAYDTPNDLDPLQAAGKMLLDAGFTKASNVLQCYVLIGFRATHRKRPSHD